MLLKTFSHLKALHFAPESAAFHTRTFNHTEESDDINSSLFTGKKAGWKMKIAVCDDEMGMREEIARLIKMQIPKADVFLFASGEELLASERDFDILFLDIAMEKMSGMQVAEKIREQQKLQRKTKSILIFVTGYREYMETAFDVNAYHYLMKPIDENKFAAVLKRAWQEVNMRKQQEEQYIIVKSLHTKVKLFLKDIYYIESSNKKVLIHMKDKIVENYGKMEEFESMLGPSFYRCHRCYLVNFEHISSYSADTIWLINDDSLLLARKKYSDFVKKYLQYAKNGGIVNV